MKINLTKSELELLIREAIDVRDASIDTVAYFANKPKCQEYLTKQTLPDWFLAIFFGDQLLGAGANTRPSSGMLKNMISNDTITRKIQTPGALERSNKIEPATANAIRSLLGKAIDFAFPIGAAEFCKLLAASVEYATKVMDALGLSGVKASAGGVAAGGAAAAAAASTTASVNISPEVQSIYTKVAQNDYFAKLNRGRITGVTPMDFFFFPFSMGALSSGNPAQLTDVVVEADLKALKEKLRDVKGVGKFRGFFENFFDEAFYNPVVKSSSEAKMTAQSEIAAIEQKLSAAGAQQFYEKISDELKLDFENRARNHIVRFQGMMSNVPNGQNILQLFSRYSL